MGEYTFFSFGKKCDIVYGETYGKEARHGADLYRHRPEVVLRVGGMF